MRQDVAPLVPQRVQHRAHASRGPVERHDAGWSRPRPSRSSRGRETAVIRRRDALALAPALLARPAAAQGSWAPSRPVTLLVPFPPGGATDLCARAVQPGLTGLLGQPVVVENRPGATGVTGTRYVAGLPGDGHVLLFNASGTMTIQPLVMARPGFDPVRDLKAVTLAMSAPNVVAVHPGLPVRTVGELQEWMLAQRDGVSFASSGVGSSEQLGMELLLLRTGARGVHVPFPGGAPAITAVMSGQVPVTMVNSGTAGPQIAAGQLRAIAVAGPRRITVAPDVPTLAEAGYPDLFSVSWTGVFLPASTPDPIADRLNTVLVAALRAPEVVERLARIGFTVEASSREDLTRLAATDLARWRGVVRDAQIKVN
ncbi:Bug family tripartite tricarboxylate transporter substrate binding protein [Muricoccus radiodurans]|uniref:Bug family tripartite tricarboxylate transporter substrate binding protein n=1 Tax=Muricoccus radiodurans TaxID=2231721 RepID=UPI003CE7CDEE